MKLAYLTIASHDDEYLTRLKESCPNLHVIRANWQGFGTKVIEVKKYIRTLEGYTHFVFVDAYDTFFQAPILNVLTDEIVFSCEKHKWPDASAPYKETSHVWQYLNAGAYIAPIKKFLEVTDKYHIEYQDDDQRYFTKIFLDGHIKLDYNCEWFQSYAFSSPGDFTITDKLVNNITGTTPAVIHFNGKCHDLKVYNMKRFETLQSVKDFWKDTKQAHKEINEGFIDKVNNFRELKEHRDFVEQNAFGLGERSFLWMWWLIVKELPKEFTFLEIGVLKGQILSLIELIAQKQGKKAIRYGVTPLSTEGGVWESDYKADIEAIHDKFALAKDYKLLVGLSEDEKIIKKANKLNLDVLFIDGGHEDRHIRNDIDKYSHLVKKGGYMVIDDCCNSFDMEWGYFQGIDAVSKVVDEKLPPVTKNDDWQFEISVVHNRVYLRK